MNSNKRAYRASARRNDYGDSDIDKKDLGDIDYKDIDFLNKFIASTGKILPRRITGVGASYQRRIDKAVKLARYLALLPYTENHRPFSVVVSSERKPD